MDRKHSILDWFYVIVVIASTLSIPAILAWKEFIR